MLTKLRLLATVLFLSFYVVASAVAQNIVSPTGRTPKLHWTPERQAVWNRMVAENHPWWQYIKPIAEGTVIRYGDLGDFATLAYQMTGDTRYARNAWNRIKPVIDTMRPEWNSRNGTREETIDWAWRYDWLYPALSPDERALFLTYLNTLADLILNKSTQPWGTRLGDSDETVGHYFGLALIALATGSENPRAAGLLNEQWMDATVTLKSVGGLDATASDNSTMRNGVRLLVDKARGGTWLESSGYNQGTLQLLIVGYDGVLTGTGSEHFPEIRDAVADFGRVQIQQVVPSLNDSAQWGDEQDPQTIRLYARLPLTGLLSGVVSSQNPTLSQDLNRLVTDFTNTTTGDAFARRPSARFFLLHNPFAPQRDWRQEIGNVHYSAGMGHLYYRTGWSDSDSMLHFLFSRRPFVDHEVYFANNFRLWRKGEWVINHPFGYGIVDGGGTTHTQNSLLFAGLSSVGEARGPVAHETAADFAYMVGAMGGAWAQAEGYYAPPPPFLNEHTRSAFFKRSPDGKYDLFVVYDRTDSKNPLALPSSDRYQAVLTRMRAASDLKEWIIHTPVSPSVDSRGFEWQTGTNQHVRVTTLLPLQQKRRILDESTMDMGGSIYSTQRKWQVRISPERNELDPNVATRYYDTFLNVFSVSDETVPPDVTLVTSSEKEMEGALVQWPGQQATAVLFSAKQGEELPPTPIVNSRQVYDPERLEKIGRLRVRSAGFAVSLSLAATSAAVFVADLDPSKRWLVTDNGSVKEATVSAQGLCRLALAGAGAHALVFTASDSPPNPNPPAAPSNLRIDS